MAFRSFRIQVIIRILLLVLWLSLIVLLVYYAKYVSAFIILVILIIQISGLIYYVENTNRKLKRFIESIRYDDYSPGFEADDHLGKSFRELNDAFKRILNLLKKTRKEKEENYQLLEALVKNANVGLMVYHNASGKIETINPMFCSLIECPSLVSIEELKRYQPDFGEKLEQTSFNQSQLYRFSTNKHLIVYMSAIRVKESTLNIVSLQNIQSELQENELQAWQNLTKVLRHEIMNSVTPISSLIATLNQIFEEELKDHDEQKPLDKDLIGDIKEALQAIQNRSQALKSFVQAYRNFTQVPKPNLGRFAVKDLLEDIDRLHKSEFEKNGVDFSLTCTPEDLALTADRAQIEMILINLVKNAIEAKPTNRTPKIEIIVQKNVDAISIKVRDNGQGIVPEAISQVFIPFFSTKPEGSGIGLSLSRQIMHMHKGNLTVASIPNNSTEFTLHFWT